MIDNVIDEGDVLRPKMVMVEIAGKAYDVPEGITIIKALWYAGHDVIRGAGCLGGFCGACAAYYRLKDDPKVKTCLACQTAVQDGMSLSMVPAFPARKALYDMSASFPLASISAARRSRAGGNAVTNAVISPINCLTLSSSLSIRVPSCCLTN